MNEIQQLCDEVAGTNKVLQGNIAFAVGCVRAGIHAADGYPSTPSTETIEERGLSQALAGSPLVRGQPHRGVRERSRPPLSAWDTPWPGATAWSP